jgi:hypothetical protein
MLKVCSFFAAILLLASEAGAEPSDPEIRIVGDSRKPTAIEVAGLPKQQLAELTRRAIDDPAWTTLLSVFVAEGSDAANPVAILGSYSVEGTAIRFTPRYALRPGLKYRVVLRQSARDSLVAQEVTREISIPAMPPAEPTRVTTIYPSPSTLPENQLRFYVHFSAPMAAGDAYAHVKLLKASGEVVNRAFLEIGEELWDGSGQRLTLLFDPGRVKKGLSPRAQFGPVLEPGQTYRLAIDKAWRDANGQPLAADFEKRFTASPAVETAVDFKQWKITPAAARSREPLVIQFPRPLDRALLMRMIRIADSGENRVSGEIVVADQERRWEFRPDQPWAAGKFALVVDTALEDSAGNNLARPFEVDVFEKIDASPEPELIRIPFAVAPPKE